MAPQDITEQETGQMINLTARIAEDQITATATYRDQGAPSYAEDMTDMDWWDVTLHMDGRALRIPFGMGYGHNRQQPDAYEVLSSMLSDASGVENASDFSDWADEYGYDTDSRKAERTYNQTVKHTDKLREFLGDKYDAYLWETEQD